MKKKVCSGRANAIAPCTPRMPLRPRRDPCQYQAITTKCHCPLRGLRQAVRQRRAMQNLKRRACKACLLARFLGVIASSARIEPMQHFERFAMSRVSLCRELQHESIYHMTSVRGCREPSHAECDNHADVCFTRCLHPSA